MTDWTPIIVALAGAITILAPAIAIYIQAHANGRRIAGVDSKLNGGLDTLAARVLALELAISHAANIGREPTPVVVVPPVVPQAPTPPSTGEPTSKDSTAQP